MSKINELFGKDLVIANVGLESFARELKSQDVKTIHVSWRPPAGGNQKLIGLLAKLGR
ncbi:MAG: fdrA domain protein [Firmicutes bacterium]|jgi:hypothetical protein|nr:fdrA domain protein [Bacillota bacterium]